MKTKNTRYNSYKLHLGINVAIGLAAISLFGVTGMRLMQYSSAATINPYGWIDYCELVNNKTVIYGWAADANAISLSQPSVSINIGINTLTRPTNVAGFREAPINKYIDEFYPGDPKPGTYGYQATFENLFKGNRYAISGNVINVGPGSNTPLTVKTESTIDGIARKTFPGGVVPDTCLANPPAAQAPAPAPAPMPSPAPPPAAAPKPPVSTPQSRTAPIPGSPVSPATSPLSAAADATIIAGTYGILATIPAGNATKAWIEYGTNVSIISTKSIEVAISGSNGQLEVRDLKPGLQYEYRIVRQGADGKTITSPSMDFMTRGITVRIQMYSNKKPAKSISGQLPGKATTQIDSTGTLTYTDVLPGNQKFNYTYRGTKLTKDIPVTAAGPSATKPASSIDTFTYRFDLPTVATAQQKQPAAPFPWSLTTAIVAIAGLLAAIGYILARLRRRGAVAAHEDYDVEPEALAAYTPLPSQPETENMGKSLRQMVIEGMADEAKRRKVEDTPPPLAGYGPGPAPPAMNSQPKPDVPEKTGDTPRPLF